MKTIKQLNEMYNLTTRAIIVHSGKYCGITKKGGSLQ